MTTGQEYDYIAALALLPKRTGSVAEGVRELQAHNDNLQAELLRLQEIQHRGCDCAQSEACAFARERDEARAEVKRLRKALEGEKCSE